MRLVTRVTEILSVDIAYTINVASIFDMLASVEINVLVTDLVNQYKGFPSNNWLNNQLIKEPTNK